RVVAAAAEPFAVTQSKVSIVVVKDRPSSPVHVALHDAGGSPWTLSNPSPEWVRVSPASGTGSAMFAIGPAPFRRAADTTVAIRVHAQDPPAVQQIDVRVKSIASMNTPPAGAVDMPPDPVDAAGSDVTFQGWALDPLGMQSIEVAMTDAHGHQ